MQQIFKDALQKLKKKKKKLEQIKRYEDVSFSGLKQNIFGTNHYYYFHLPFSTFHCTKFKTILTTDPEL